MTDTPAPLPTIDAIGLQCPLPVLKLRKALSRLAAGQSVALLADDPMAWLDVEHFCAEQGHLLLDREDEQGRLRFVVRKAPAEGSH
ncbi:MAG: sulfurtransferase TusA family protein [Neomegalonema sp.]|nr:sulfurtransferase TusA family protein [Neomegalonema sp.]